MGDVKTCDYRCHRAKKPRCECWCGGAFHGAQGAQNRDNFVEVMQKVINDNGLDPGEIGYQAELFTK